LRILILHNRYVYSGGEDVVVAAESELLRAYGHEVRVIEADNRTIGGMAGKVRTGLQSIYSGAWRRRVEEEAGTFRAEVVHVHNFFPLISPSVYAACKDVGVPVAQTLHNYRIICPGATLARDSRVCEECVGKSIAWPAIRHACYRNDRAATAATAAMFSFHRIAGTWNHDVDAYIALSDFGRRKFVKGGLPADRIHVKPNFTTDCGIGDGKGGYFLFAGRLSTEKGVRSLLKAYESGRITVPLKIVGTGPLDAEVDEASATLKNVEWLGKRDSLEVRELMKSALAIACPSEWYEMHPLVVIEALSVGTPVIAPRLGAFSEVICHQRTGLLYEAFDQQQLFQALQRASAHQEEMLEMREFARGAFEERYTPEANHRQLMQIYDSVSSSRNRDVRNVVPVNLW
jgi:glycosyltransferase involved in cell wall biosynthesis